jgi:4-hydroxybenzoate polyprenyltransferase
VVLLLSDIPFHIYTLYLFVYSDLKVIVFPSTIFALSYSISHNQHTTSSSPTNHHHDPTSISTATLLYRVPLIIFWCWLNCLAFNINNHKFPHAISEDAVNKPWRPLPSKRLTQRQTSLLATLVYPVAVLTSWMLGGGLVPSILLALFGYAYNDAHIGDKSLVGRNALNACGFVLFSAGALQVAIRSQGLLDRDSLTWLGMVGLVVVSTIQIQDLYDEPGDRDAGRRTMPIVFGDKAARWSVIVPLALWSVVCPAYWKAGALACWVVAVLACVVGGRLLAVKSVEGDKRTFMIYNGWLMAIYMLPFISGMKEL